MTIFTSNTASPVAGEGKLSLYVCIKKIGEGCVCVCAGGGGTS